MCDVVSQVKGEIVGADKFLDPLKEPQRRRKRDAEVETPQNFVFHLEDVRLGDGLVRGHLEHLSDRRRVDFFVLGRDEEGAQRQQLQVAFLHSELLYRQIDQFARNEESLWKESELVVDFGEPLN